MAVNESDPEGWMPGHRGPVGLYYLFWRLRGEQCTVRQRLYYDVDAGGRVAPVSDEDNWAAAQVSEQGYQSMPLVSRCSLTAYNAWCSG